MTVEQTTFEPERQIFRQFERVWRIVYCEHPLSIAFPRSSLQARRMAITKKRSKGLRASFESAVARVQPHGDRRNRRRAHDNQIGAPVTVHINRNQLQSHFVADRNCQTDARLPGRKTDINGIAGAADAAADAVDLMVAIEIARQANGGFFHSPDCACI